MKFHNKITSLILKVLLVIFLMIIPIMSVIPVEAALSHSEVQSVVSDGMTYLQTQLNEDGGIRWVDENSSVPTSIRVLLALAAAGFSQDKLTHQNGNRPVDYLAQEGVKWVFQSETDNPALNIARAGQLLTAVAAANQNPFAFGTDAVNLIHLINTHYDPNTGVYGNATPENVTDQVWAMLGLAASYASVPKEAVSWLASAQLEDGSWDDGFGSYLDTTPLALMALTASGPISEKDIVILQAIDFIRGNQNSNGGWQTSWDTTTNANTTGIILQALYAAGQDPTDEDWVKDEGTPFSALLNLQKEDGSIGGDFTNAYSTADAILGLSGQLLFDLGHVRRVGQAFEYIFAAQASDGGWGAIGQTIDVVIAAHAAGWDPISVTRDGNSPLTYIASGLDAYLETGPDAIGKAILGLIAAGQDPTQFNGVDLVSALMETYNPELGAFGSPDNSWHQALAMLGLSAAGSSIPEGAVQTLLDLQSVDGGWEYSPGFGTWPDNTALALQALNSAGISSNNEAIQNGLAFIRSQQLEDGGWGDSSTSAYVLMALNAMGLESEAWQTDTGRNPVDNLFSYQKPSGAFMFSEDFPDENLMATATAALAAVGSSFMISTPELEIINTAGLVIQTDQGEVTTACVAFEDESISGLALLDNSGIPYELQDGFTNSILDISNPQGGTMYWSYWHWNGREWIFNNTGAGDSKVLSGSIEGWYFTSWEVFPSLPPEFVPDFNSICEQNVLKNYTVQPYLNYYDLKQTAETVNQVALHMEGEPTEDMSHVSTNASEAEQSLPLTPIIIIGTIGLVVLIFIVWILIRKN